MDYIFLSKTKLFNEITENEIKVILNCLKSYTKKYDKGDLIYKQGEIISSIGIILLGSINIENDDIWGNKNILENISMGNIFGETYACIENEEIMVNVVAAEPCEILFINIDKVLRTCSNACKFHIQLIKNLLSLTSQKNISLTRKIFHTSPKSIRGRILSYLSYQAILKGNTEFEIPFNRQQLADYLSVDRSALSNELSKMEKDGIILYNKNKFKIINLNIFS